MRQAAIITGLILILSLASACTGKEPPREPNLLNAVQPGPPTTQPASDSRPTEMPEGIAELEPTTEPPTTAPTATATAEPGTGLNCDGIFRNQLVFQRGASNADRMNILVSQVKSQYPECDAEVWNPTVLDLDLGPPAVGSCYGTAGAKATGSTRDAAATASKVGNAEMPHGLLIQTNAGYESPVKSGRDSENNIIVYFDLDFANGPSDGASCWLYQARSKTWHENFYMEGKPEPAHPEQTGRPAVATSNICWRTPEVQAALIELLKIPSCQLITEAELFRIREFKVILPKAKPGDFDHMPNLRILHITGLRMFPEGGTFDGLNNLEDLNIQTRVDGWKEWGRPRPTEFVLNTEILAGLDSLKSLAINDSNTTYREADLILEGGALDGLDQLEYISLGNIEEISAADLASLNSIRHVNIQRKWPPSGQTQDAPILPSDLIAGLPTVEELEVRGFQWPTAMEMNSLEHACLMEDKGGIPHPTVMTVGGKIIQHQGREHRDGKSFCILKVGDEIQEVPLPKP